MIGGPSLRNARETARPMVEITPDLVLRAYAAGVFPMAEDGRDDALFWVDPEHRCIIPPRQFHVPRRLARTVRAERFEVSVDRRFEGVIRACAGARRDTKGTWINQRIVDLYGDLHAQGFVHSLEVWREGRLVGGLYGVALGAAFFGESMFSHERDASKVGLVHLVARLLAGGYLLLDAQFTTTHLAQFGAVEIARERYHQLLASALDARGDFYCLAEGASGAAVLQAITQTS